MFLLFYLEAQKVMRFETMKFILKLEAVLIMVSLMIASTFVQIKAPFLAFMPVDLPELEHWGQWGILQLGSYTTTLQLLTVIACILIFDATWATVAMGIYLILGFLGFPIFFHGGGNVYLNENTFGYLISFLGAVWVGRFVLKRKKDQLVSRGQYLLTGFICLLFIHITGGIYAAIFDQMIPVEFLLRYAAPQIVWQSLALFVLSAGIYSTAYFFQTPSSTLNSASSGVALPQARAGKPRAKWRKSA